MLVPLIGWAFAVDALLETVVRTLAAWLGRWDWRHPLIEVRMAWKAKP